MVSGRPLSTHVDKVNPTQGVVNLTYSTGVVSDEVLSSVSLGNVNGYAGIKETNMIVEEEVKATNLIMNGVSEEVSGDNRSIEITEKNNNTYNKFLLQFPNHILNDTYEKQVFLLIVHFLYSKYKNYDHYKNMLTKIRKLLSNEKK